MSVMTWNLSETRFYAKMSLSFHFSVNLIMKMSLIHQCVSKKKFGFYVNCASTMHF